MDRKKRDDKNSKNKKTKGRTDYRSKKKDRLKKMKKSVNQNELVAMLNWAEVEIEKNWRNYEQAVKQDDDAKKPSKAKSSNSKTPTSHQNR